MIPLFKVPVQKSVLEPLTKTLLSGYITQGPKVEEFERALVPWVGSPNVLTLNSGTSAITLALRLCDVGPGSEVISTPQTCAATNVPILDRGADLVWGDIDPWTGNLDPIDVERKITRKTKAIVAVHWGGYPCELDGLLKISKKYGVPLIEDAAHAFGSTYRDKPIGSFSSYCCFSFQAIKLVTTVDGGLLVCPSIEGYRRGKLLRWFGIDRDTPRTDLRCENDLVEAGYKFHMNDVSAVIGLDQLKTAAERLQTQRENAAFYNDRLTQLRKIKRLRYTNDRLSAYWLYTIRVDDRAAFQAHMTARGVQVSQVHVRNDLHTAFTAHRRNLPGVDDFSREQVSIPVGWWITKKDREKIFRALEEYDRS